MEEVFSVEKLIEKLSLIKNKKKPVKFFHQNRQSDWLRLPVYEMADNTDYVLLGDDLPAEVFETDYKFER